LLYNFGNRRSLFFGFHSLRGVVDKKVNKMAHTLAVLNSVGIFLKAENLPEFPHMGLNPNNKYDAFVVIYMKNAYSGTTETIVNSRNPAWTKLLMIEYKFQERQFLKFKIFYKHPKYEEVCSRLHLFMRHLMSLLLMQSMIDKHHSLGEVSMTLKELVEEVLDVTVRFGFDI
jgi:hypothetical protein